MPLFRAAPQGPVHNSIETKLADALTPRHLEVVNESHRHAVPPGSESHFKVVIVADVFEGEKLIARHRRINSILKAELASGVHALAMHTYTEREWRARFGEAPLSPPCLGGDKKSRETPPCLGGERSKETPPCLGGEGSKESPP